MDLQTNGQKVIKVIRGNGLNELALFAGAGGGILGGHLLGWRTVCAVEWEQYPACVLAARQNDGILPPFPIWDDVQTFDGNPWRGIVDVVSGGFPCQDISAAGKGAGIDGERSGMWKEMARIISEVRPKYAFVENSPMLTTRGLGTVLSDFSKMGFDAEWGVLSAADVGANHLRERIWIVAKSTQQPRFFPHAQYNRIRWWEQQSQSIEEKVDISNTNSKSWNGWLNREFRLQICGKKGKWGEKTIRGTDMQLIKNGHQCTPIFGESPPTPEFLRMVDGVAASVDRLKAIGNGQVPLCAATAWNILKGRLDERI